MVSVSRPKAVSRKDAAHLLGLSLSTVARMLREGHLRHRKVGGRVLIPATEIDRLLEAD